MSIEIVEQNFGRWITPDQQAGITPPENLYDASGMPLPTYREGGGPTMFRSSDGQAYTAGTAPMQATSSPTLPSPAPTGQGPTIARPANRVQIPMMLRGEPGGPSQATAGLDLPSYAYPDAGPGPQNLLPPPGRSMGTRAVLPIPPAPTNRVAVPSEAQERTTLQSNSQRTVEDTVARQAISDRALERARNPRGNSTTPTPQTQGPAPSRNNNQHPMDTTFQQVIRRPGATVRDMLEAGGFNFDWFGNRTQTPQQETPVTDVRGRTGNTQRISQFGDAPTYNLSTPDGLADFNARMGLNLTNQVRTQAEQDRLFNNHQTPTRNSYHITGEAFDVPPDAIGGLTGENAVNAVLTRMREARYNVDDYELKWETGHGRNQGTGAHVHVEPRRRRR